MATLFQVLQFFDGNGDPLNGGKLFWYEAGTTTPKDTWIDQAETNPAPNPIVLDSDGRPPLEAIWIRGSYKLILKDSMDVTIQTIDDINEYDSRDWSGLTASVADLNSTTTSTIVTTSDYTVVLADRNKTILADANSGNVIIRLPEASVVGNTFRIFIKNTTSNQNLVYALRAGTDEIDGATEFFISNRNDLVGLQSTGSGWFSISKHIRGRTVATAAASFTLGLLDEDKVFLVNALAGNKIVTLPSASAVGRGYEVTIKKTDVSSNFVEIKPPGLETVDDGAFVRIVSPQVAFTFKSDGTNWKIKASHERSQGVELPQGYINGCLIENYAGDVAHDIKAYTGEARDTGDSTNLFLKNDLIKQLDNNWVEGTLQGGRPTGVGLTADTWYHFFLIGVPGATTQTASKIDAGYDTSFTATNLLSDAATFGYTTYRYIGSVLTDALSNIVPFYMYRYGQAYREVYWKTLVSDANLSSANPDPAVGTITLRVPPNVPSRAVINVTADAADSDEYMYFKTPQQAAVIPEKTTPTLNMINHSPAAFIDMVTIPITTNASRLIDYNTTTFGGDWAFNVSTMSWIVNLSI